MPVPKGVSKKKYDDCVDQVKAKGKVDSPYAVCAASLMQAFAPKPGKVQEDKKLGGQGWGKIWFTTWMSAFGRSKIKPAESTEAQPKIDDSGHIDGHDAAAALLVQNPEINGSTLLNLLKAKGFQIVAPKVVDPAAKEADAASANVASMRAGVKKESAKLSLTSICNFRESSYRDNGIGATKYRVVLIKEGLGNFRDAFYYPKDALKFAVPLFEGKKCYANHPSLSEEKDRPERDVREIIGHFENCALEEGEDGQAMIAADCCLMPDGQYEWARGLFRETVEYSKKYPDKDLVGLSINANGDADEVRVEDFLKESRVPGSSKLKLAAAQEQGIDRIRVVSRITDAMSCDLVTEAGAGGRIVKLIEGDKI